MDIRIIRRSVQIIVFVAGAVLVGVIGYGVAEGSLRPGSATSGFGSQTGALGWSTTTGPRTVPDDIDLGILLVSHERPREIQVIDPRGASGHRVKGTIALPAEPVGIVPTPGGVSVWVTFADRSEIDVYSTTTFELEARITPEGAAGRVPEHLTFSETGEILFVTWRGVSDVSIYGHQMRELSLRTDFSAEGTVGPITRNRRAGRLFRVTSDGDIAVFFGQNGERIDTISGTGLDPESPHLVFDPSYTFLTGTSSRDTSTTAGGRDRLPVVVHEAEGTVEHIAAEPPAGAAGAVDAADGDDSSAAGAGVAAGPHVVLGGPARAIFAAADQRSLLSVGLDDNGSITRLPLAESAAIDDTVRAAGLVDSGFGVIWIIADDGRFVSLDPAHIGEARVVRVDAGKPRLAAAFSIQTGGNFACF